MTADDLRARGEAVVDRLLRENQHRWRSLEPADRLRVEQLAREVAARLLDEPARRVDSANERVVADLFALPQSSAERRTRVSI